MTLVLATGFDRGRAAPTVDAAAGRDEAVTSDDRRAVRVVVHGHVQGVFFRASTADRAGQHDVAGWVRNDPGGTVTAHLQGDPDDVEAVLGWIRDGGPRRAAVQRVDVEDVPAQPRDGFEVVR